MAQKEADPVKKAEALRRTQRHNGAFASGFASVSPARQVPAGGQDEDTDAQE